MRDHNPTPSSANHDSSTFRMICRMLTIMMISFSFLILAKKMERQELRGRRWEGA